MKNTAQALHDAHQKFQQLWDERKARIDEINAHYEPLLREAETAVARARAMAEANAPSPNPPL